jgi:hypothetical protein
MRAISLAVGPPDTAPRPLREAVRRSAWGSRAARGYWPVRPAGSDSAPSPGSPGRYGSAGPGRGGAISMARQAASGRRLPSAVSFKSSSAYRTAIPIRLLRSHGPPDRSPGGTARHCSIPRAPAAAGGNGLGTLLPLCEGGMSMGGDSPAIHPSPGRLHRRRPGQFFATFCGRTLEGDRQFHRSDDMSALVTYERAHNRYERAHKL